LREGSKEEEIKGGWLKEEEVEIVGLKRDDGRETRGVG
jgi:hypothetical protein